MNEQKQPKIVGKVVEVHPQIIGRDLNGNLIIQFVLLNQVVVQDIKDADVIEWLVDNGIKMKVNGKIIADEGKVQIKNPPQKKKSMGIDIGREIIIDKEGIVRYKDTREQVI